MFTRLKALIASNFIARFIGPVPGAIAKHLNVQELVRIVVTTITSTGSAAAILPALLAHVGLFVAAPDVAFASALLTVIVEIVRRLGHGAPLPAALRTR